MHEEPLLPGNGPIELQERMKPRDALTGFELLNRGESYSCEICYEKVHKDEVFFLKCGHYFCEECFKDYFTSLIEK